MKSLILTFALFLLITVNFQLKAQKSYTIASNTELKVSGTSSIHDWEMKSAKATGNGTVTLDNGKLIKLSSLKLNLPVKSLKSGKGQMDANAYKALKADDYNNIIFELLEVEKITSQIVTAKFKLTIAGTTRIVKVDARYNVIQNTILFTGDLGIKFTDFNLEPPTAVFGTVKTGNDLVLSFNVPLATTTKTSKINSTI